MDADNLPKTPRRPEAIGAGELVVQNGRQAGAQRPLGALTTILGRGPNCDIRLNVDGVDPLHCLIVHSPEGVHLRDLDSVHGTFVNGQRVENVPLRRGDLLAVGPFQFRVELPASPRNETPPAAQEEMREALRIQAAAVAAQQASLDEEELRLQQRRADLQHQEEQLAAHLAEKQRQLQQASEHAKAERETFRAEKIEHEKSRAAFEEEILDAREAIQKQEEKLNLERQRIDAVYRRLRQRWKTHWTAEREKNQRHAAKMAAEAQALQERQELLRVQEKALEEEIVRCNTERELSKRQLQDGRAALAQERARWRRRRSLEMRALKSQTREADDVRRKTNQARAMLSQEKDAWDKQRAALRTELHGLNNRIVHLRRRADRQGEEIDRLDAQLRERGEAAAASSAGDAGPDESAPFEGAVEVVTDETAAPVHAAKERLDALNQLTTELADQRVHLLEQYTRLAEIQDAWQAERQRAAADLESLAQRLFAEEQRLAQRQTRADQTESALHERRREIDALRDAVLVARAQTTARERTFALEHQRQMEVLREKEALLRNQLAALADLRQAWNQRREEESQARQASQAALAAQEKQTQELRESLFAKHQRFEEEKRLLTEKGLALEQYQQQVFSRAKDPAAQRRVERLRRRWVTLNAALIREARNECENTKREFAKLDARRADVFELLDRMAKNDAVLSEKQTLLEERERVLDARQAQAKLELARLESQRRLSEQRHLHVLDEVDLLATAVYTESDDAPPAEKAA